MSLLLEALKKAEKAKEEAQRRAEAKNADELSLAQDAAPPQGEAKSVRTRDQLPDISQPLEILSDDIAPAEQPRAAEAKLALEEERPTAKGAAPSEGIAETATASVRRRAAPHGERARSPNADAQAGDRAAARKVFEVKFKEPHPRMPLYITMGVLGLFAIGAAVYFWYQLRPPPSLVNTSPQRPPGEKPVAAAQTKPAAAWPVAPPAIPGLPPLGAQPAGPATPPALAAAAAPAVRAPASTPAVAPPRAAAKPAEKPVERAPRITAAAPRRAPESEAASVLRAAPRVDPRIEAAYGAYQAGNLDAAREGYQQALRDDPANRDALLGLAAVEMRMQRYEAAEAHYRRLLQANPRDPHAQAGMLALRSELIDPVLAESRVKTLLAADPSATVLYFTLGNQYAQQERWAEAQQAYFKAFAADPDNPDFAYNLAVSLDHLRKPKLALEHYRRALALAQKRGASFDPAAARSRVQELTR